MATISVGRPEFARRGLATLALPLALWGLFVVLFWPFTEDDAFILFRYAYNWASGHQFVFNYPGIPVDGYSSFAWTFLFGSLSRLGVPWDLEFTAKLLGTLFGIATLLLIWRLPDFSAQPAPTRWTALLLAAVAPPLIVGAIDGLETSMYVAVQMTLVWCWLCDVRHGTLSLLSGLLGGLLTLVRPDGVVLPVLLLGAFLWMRRADGPALLRASAQMAAGFTLVVLPHFLWHLKLYGHPLPNTFYVKTGGHPDQLFAGVLKISSALKECGGWATIMIVAIAFAGRVTAYHVALVAVVVSRSLFTIWSGGEIMGHQRFFAPALPAYFLLFQLGMDQLDRGFSTALTEWPRSWPRRCFRLAPLVIVAYMISRPVLDTRRESMEYVQAMQRAHIRLGRDLRAEAPPGAKVAIGDAGAVPYYSGLYSIDILGLNDSYLAHLPGRYTQKMDVDYVLGQKPDFVVVVSKLPAEQGFVPEYRVDGLLQTALAQTPAYALWRVYEFKEHYFLWVYRRGDPRLGPHGAKAPPGRG
jgi:arabinofuranosyltransferase